MQKKKITVIGSINMDLVTKVKQPPKVGETVLGESFFTIPGGKGANQAVAAARLGASVTMIGAVGNDSFGKDLVNHLNNEGINTENVKPVTHSSTGIATIVLSEGDNSIIVIPGANFELSPDIIEQHEEIIAASDIVLLQLEIPLVSVEKAVELANKHQVKVILNPAPIQSLPLSLLQKVDLLTPNEHEQEFLLSTEMLPVALRNEILQKCIVTKGAQGVTIFQNGEDHISSYKVEVVDTTGAGDTFNGALAYGLSEGMDLKAACQFATAAAAISVTKLGAQGGMPMKHEVDEFLNSRGG